MACKAWYIFTPIAFIIVAGMFASIIPLLVESINQLDEQKEKLKSPPLWMQNCIDSGDINYKSFEASEVAIDSLLK